MFSHELFDLILLTTLRSGIFYSHIQDESARTQNVKGIDWISIGR